MEEEESQSLCNLLMNLSIRTLDISANHFSDKIAFPNGNRLLAIILVLQQKPGITGLDLRNDEFHAWDSPFLTSTLEQLALTHISQLWIDEDKLLNSTLATMTNALETVKNLQRLNERRNQSLANISARFYRQHVQGTPQDNIIQHPLPVACQLLLQEDEQTEKEINDLRAGYRC